jgi:3-dehydrotetronate 4-kinase
MSHAALRGATDLANTLTRRGMRTILTIGVPKAVSLEAHPIVVALKSRTIPADQAVALSAHQGIGMRYCIVKKTN